MKRTPTVLALMMAFLTGPAAAASFEGVAPGAGVVWISGGPVAPAVLVVPAGTSVLFPNDDAFYHSVYSVSPSNPFDLGLYDNGPGKSVSFDNPGIVEIRCHVHGSMHATIVVVDGPYAMTTRPGERYRIDDVAPGPHVLHVWTGGAAATSESVLVKQRGGAR